LKGLKVGLERRSLSVVPVQENAIRLVPNFGKITQRLREKDCGKEVVTDERRDSI
jgi:hypothetical protein